MALDMNKYKSMLTVERKLPIIFVINEKALDKEAIGGGLVKDIIVDIMANLNHRSIEATMSVVSFGDEVRLLGQNVFYKDYKDDDYPELKTSGKSAFNVALALLKDMLEDVDTVPEGNYDPIVILISSDEVTPGYEEALEMLNKVERFKDVQKIGVANFNCWKTVFDKQKYIPKVLREFAGNNVIVFYENKEGYQHWESLGGGLYNLENKDGYTWECPVLGMMEMRYIENGKLKSIPVEKKKEYTDNTSSSLTDMLGID